MDILVLIAVLVSSTPLDFDRPIPVAGISMSGPVTIDGRHGQEIMCERVEPTREGGKYVYRNLWCHEVAGQRV